MSHLYVIFFVLFLGSLVAREGLRRAAGRYVTVISFAVIRVISHSAVVINVLSPF